MTDDELTALESLANAATPGEWRAIPYAGPGPDGSWQVDAPITCVADCFESDRPKADAAFIAAARTSVPALIAEVRRLRLDYLELQAMAANQGGTIIELQRAIAERHTDPEHAAVWGLHGRETERRDVAEWLRETGCTLTAASIERGEHLK